MPLFTSAQYTTDPAAAAALTCYNGTISGFYSPTSTLPPCPNYTLEPCHGTTFHTGVYTEWPLRMAPSPNFSTLLPRIARSETVLFYIVVLPPLRVSARDRV